MTEVLFQLLYGALVATPITSAAIGIKVWTERSSK